MSETKFTKGEWKLGGDYTTDSLWVSPPNENENVICDIVRRMPDNMIEDEANAHLIAAAPDLYRALEDLTKACLLADGQEELPASVDGGLLDRAHAALAKARGETT